MANEKSVVGMTFRTEKELNDFMHGRYIATKKERKANPYLSKDSYVYTKKLKRVGEI